MGNIINDTTTTLAMIGGFLAIICYLYRINSLFEKKLKDIGDSLEKERDRAEKERAHAETQRALLEQNINEFKTHIRTEIKESREEADKKFVGRDICKTIHEYSEKINSRLEQKLDDFIQDVSDKFQILNDNVMKMVAQK